MTPLSKPSFATPSLEENAHSAQLFEHIKTYIAQQSGWINFAQYMEMALYTPALGYYAGGRQKIGQGGDFITAPEMSALFGQTIANQLAEILQHLPNANILELGAGTGKLAIDILHKLESLQTLPQHYYILEVSNHLRTIQQENCQKNLSNELFDKIVWLSEMPANIEGVAIANEVLDAIPVHLVRQTEDGIYELGVSVNAEKFIWQEKLLSEVKENSEYTQTKNISVSERQLSSLVKQQNLPVGMLTEFCPAAAGLIKSLAAALKKGVILMIDYGFSSREYYHPQRTQGTLMCHYQHYAHSDPLIQVGLQDITAHVDFTHIAQAGVDAGLAFAGYTTQAQFLMNCGLLEAMQTISPENLKEYVPMTAAVQKLLSPAEMGELFKVIAFSKAFDEHLMGFSSGDKSHTL